METEGYTVKMGITVAGSQQYESIRVDVSETVTLDAREKVDDKIQRPSVKASTPPVPSARANALKRLTQLIPRTQKRRLKPTTSPTRDTGAIEMTTYNPLVARKTTSPAEDDLKREPEEVISPLSAHIKDKLGFTESLKSKKQIISEKKMPQNICPNIYTNGLNVDPA